MAVVGTHPPFAAVLKHGRFLGYCGREMLAVSLSGLILVATGIREV